MVGANLIPAGARQRATAALTATLACLTALALALLWQPPSRRAPAPLPVAPSVATPPPAVEPTALRPIAPVEAKAINDAAPLAPSAGPSAAPFALLTGSTDAARAADCLAAAAYYEAGDDPEGQRAVVQVVLNRVRHPAFPKSVCGVVLQGSERRTGCQFTFTCDGSIARRQPAPAAWTRAQAVAAAALAGAVYAPVGLATHYHADYVVPYWAARLDRIARIGTHLFYRWGGWWGSPRAFTRAVLAREAGPLSLGPDTGRSPAVHAQFDGTVVVRGPRQPRLSVATDNDLFMVRLPPNASDHRSLAEQLCGDRATCTVLGWTSGGDIARSLPLTPDQLARLSFRYVRDGRSDAATSKWNCTRIPRPADSECFRGSASVATRTAEAPVSLRTIAAVTD